MTTLETLPQSSGGVIVKDVFVIANLLTKILGRNANDKMVLYYSPVTDSTFSIRIFSTTFHPGLILLPSMSCIDLASEIVKYTAEARYEKELPESQKGWEISVAAEPFLIIVKASQFSCQDA